MSSILRHTLTWLSLGVFLVLAFGLRCWNKPQVFHNGGVYFLDGDCYSRMTRVLRVLDKPFTSIRYHEFENAPIGVYPHTTAPMDLVIAGLAKGISLGSSGDIPASAELAGAYVSPILGALLIALLWWWIWRLKLPYGNAALLLVAVSPILVHGFLLGRPDHQSLILLLVGAALMAEIGIWKESTNGWKYLSAAAWGLALWTSLFEPLVLLFATLACRLLVQGRKAVTVRHWPSIAIFVGILIFAVAFDGWRFRPGETTGDVFSRWAQSIGELGHPGFAQLLPWTGWLLPIVPVLLILRFSKEKCRICLALALLVLLTIGLSLWYARWGYFLALVFALSLPWAFAAIPWRPAVWAVFLVSLWPIANEWDRQFFPSDQVADRRAEIRSEGALLRELCTRMREADPNDKTGTVLAPWWLSPSIAYWSGLPCVAGSSHQSLPGITDAAKFYLSTSRVEAEEILKQRKVKWVVFDDASRMINNSSQILDVKPSKDATAIATKGRFPEDPALRLGSPYFTIYRVKEAP
jgi:hypothetical protein